MNLNEEYSKEKCIELIQLKYSKLCRLPKRSDFSDIEVMMIKSHFGPWPRALEAAGVKEPRKTDRIEKNRLKRAAAKRRRRENIKKEDD